MKMLRKVVKKAKVAGYMAMAVAMQVRADGIPETDDFADGGEDKGGFETLLWLGEKTAQLIILGIASMFVFYIGRAAMKKYNDITDDRGTWVELGGHIIGGVVLLTLTIIMLNWVGGWVD